MNDKIVVLGKGFLGQTFERRGFEVLGKEDFLLLRDDHSSLYLNKKLSEAKIIINCIGKSDTRWCEDRSNFPSAMWSNGILPRVLSEYCRTGRKKFVHISTGCLYDDNSTPQKEDDFTVAHCSYTVTKWVGEMGCDPSRDLIIRPRLYFGSFKHKNNLICKLKKFDKFLVETNSYTSVHVIVEAVEALLHHNQSGIFNVACDGHASPLELSKLMGLDGGELTEKELHESQKLYLVNNIMDLSKLKQFYHPPMIGKEFARCYEKTEIF